MPSGRRRRPDSARTATSGVATAIQDEALRAELTALENDWFEALRVQDWDRPKNGLRDASPRVRR
jgi:hypothetical protein